MRIPRQKIPKLRISPSRATQSIILGHIIMMFFSIQCSYDLQAFIEPPFPEAIAMPRLCGVRCIKEALRFLW
jgi:hypothetical protein